MSVLSVRRRLRVLGGAALDRLAEAAYRVRHIPNGLLHEHDFSSSDAIRRAVDRGLQFLERVQEADGGWRGFMLLPGASTSWLTAHVAFTLEDVPQAGAMCARAANFLQVTGASDGGWGYNRRVAVDCDSWAQALLVLERHSLHCEEFLVRNLAATQHACGGFPTYALEAAAGIKGRSGWHSPHPEVTALVLEALRRRGGFEAQVDSGFRWLRAVWRSGAVPCYWWGDDAYALWVLSRTHMMDADSLHLVTAGLERVCALPQLAMTVAAAAELNLRAELLRPGVRGLLLQQYADGSWPCAPCLRVTDPRREAPGPATPGLVVADHRRVFSTAHAVASLAGVMDRLTATEARDFTA